MTVEARREAPAPEWSEWQSAVIKGLYPLRQVLHGSERSAVFLTEAGPQGASAAIKIVRTEQTASALQLQRWRATAALSHPHLIRLFDVGLCQLEGQSFVYVVMEHAEQTLAQLLPKRALSAEEAREMLRPTLDVLSFLHGRNLVHGQLSPAALLVVNDQLKLASHWVRAAGEARLGGGKPSLYDPPEADGGRLLPPGDIWALGITLVEGLTQSLPWPDEAQAGSASLPSLPTELAALVRRCLRHNPGSRPTAAELQAQPNGGASAPTAATQPSPPSANPAAVSTPSAPPAAAGPVTARPVTARAASASAASASAASAKPPALAPSTPTAKRETAKARTTEPAAPATHPRLTIIATAMLVAVMVIIWGGWRLFRGHTPTAPPAAAVETSSPPVAGAPVAAASAPLTPSAPPAAVVHSKAPAAAANSDTSVLHAQIPAVSRAAQRTIRGHIKVAVVVTVDRLGNVVAAMLEYAGPSPYFARLARDAARKWQFAPAAQQDSRRWLVKFEFSRDGTTGHASPRS